MEKVVVIANPAASQFTGGDHRSVMAELSRGYEVESRWPESPTEATTDAKDAVESGADIVVAVGGDGMVHHLAQALIGSDTALAIIPAGTTNVVSRLLDMPARQSRAAKLISREPTFARIGSAMMTLQRGAVETVHHAIFACGFGLDAEVVQVADSDPYRKYRFGSLHYARSAISVGLRRSSRQPHVEVTAADKSTMASTGLIQFRSVYTFFGKVGIRFSDDPPDPMSVLILERLKRRRIPRILSRALTHRDLTQIEGIRVHEGVDRIEFRADPSVQVQADGENLGLAEAAAVRWAPESLLVVTGPNPSG